MQNILASALLCYPFTEANIVVCKNHALEVIFISENKFGICTNKTGWTMWGFFHSASNEQDFHGMWSRDGITAKAVVWDQKRRESGDDRHGPKLGQP